MMAKKENWQYSTAAHVWCGSYRNSNNSPHWHYDCELLYVEHGKLQLIVENSVYVVSEGKVCYIDSERPHQMHALEPDTIVNMVIFDCNIVKPFTENRVLALPILTCNTAGEKFSELFLDLKEKLKTAEELFEYETAVTVCRYMIDVFRNEPTNKKQIKVSTTKRFKQLLLDIDKNYEFYDLQTAADFMGLSRTYFSRLFSNLTGGGQTFTKYLTTVRCEKAIEFIRQRFDMSIAEISIRCGFDTIRNFNRAFKMVTGYTPTALPDDFVLNTSVNLIEKSSNPTNPDCELISSTD